MEKTKEIKKAIQKLEVVEQAYYKNPTELLHDVYHQACHDVENLINS